MMLLHVTQALDLCAVCLSVLMQIHAISLLIFFAGVRTADGKDIICMDTDKLPKKEHFKNKKEFKQAVREFIS